MPNYDRTGPMGRGAMTGRRMGRCNPDNRDLTRDELLNRDQQLNYHEPVRGVDSGFGGRGMRAGDGAGRGRGGAGRGMGNRFGNRKW
ncbi:MAG: DUF5320 domain-containing protein [Bacteroidales bacterium]